MVRIIFTLILFFKIIFAFSQYSFIREFSSEFSYSSSKIKVIDDSYFIIANKTKKESNTDSIIEQSATIYKLSKDNQELDSLLLFDSTRRYIVNELVQLQDQNLAIIGCRKKADSLNYSEIFFVKTDLNLNVLNIILYDFNTGVMDYLVSLNKDNGNVVFAGIIQGSPPNSGAQYYDKIIMEFTPDGELVFFNTYDDTSLDIVFDLIHVPDSEYLLLYCKPNFSGNKDDTEINILDQNYNLSASYPVFEYGYVRSIRATINNNFITSSQKIVDSSKGLVWLPYINKYDTGLNHMNEILLGSYDSLSYPAKYTSLETRNGEDFYSAYTYNFDIDTFSDEHSYFLLYSINNNLDVMWQKYYGGDAYYRLEDLAIDSDEGCVLIGTKYENGLSGPFKNKLVLIKTDENGLITSTHEEESIPIKNAIITPNPGNVYLQLHTGVYPGRLQLFNVNGHLVLDEGIEQNTTTINTQNLKPGTYIWQLIKNGKVIESDKWIKI